MSLRDREVLKQISFSQAELARHLRTTRQAVCVGIGQEDDYIDTNRLLRLHDALCTNGDTRAAFVAEHLEKNHGFKIDPSGSVPTLSGKPESFPPEYAEAWFIGGIPHGQAYWEYFEQMQKHLDSSNRTFAYFVYTRADGARLAQWFSRLIRSLNRKGRETAKVHILRGNTISFMSRLVIFDPRTVETKGYVRVTNKRFARMDTREVRELVCTFQCCGVGVDKDTFLSPESGFDGITFEALYEF